MSGDQGERGPVPTWFADVPVVSGDQLDLDAIRDRFQRILAAAPVGYVWHAEDDMGTLVEYDVPALVAEVRRLRAQVDDVNRKTV